MTERTASLPGSLLTPEAPRKRGPKPRLSADEAKAITARIKMAGHEMWLLVAEAHTRRAHTALGYPTWKDYVQAELNMSESRSYQLLDAGKVVKVLEEVYGSDSSTLEAVPTSREASKAAADLPTFRSSLRALRRDGVGPSEAMHRAIGQMVLPFPKTREELDGEKSSRAKHPAGKFIAPQGEPGLPMPRGAVSCPACHGFGYLLPREG